MKNILIVAALSLLVLSGCSKSKGTSTPLVVDESLPHGIWTLDIAPETAFSARAKASSPHAGKVIITPTQIIEYYDLDAGSECSKDYTDKVVTNWNSSTGISDDGTISIAIDGNKMSLTSTQNDGDQLVIDLTYESVYSAGSEAKLDEQWCETGIDPIVSTVDGNWIQTSQTNEQSGKDRARVQLSITGFDSGVATGREYYELRIGGGVQCSTSRAITYTASNRLYQVHAAESNDPQAVINDVVISQSLDTDSLYIGGHDDGNTNWKRIPSIGEPQSTDCSAYD